MTNSNTYVQQEDQLYLVINSPKHGTFNFIIDPEDKARLEPYTWTLLKSTSKVPSFYAVGWINGKSVKLHRWIMKPSADKQVDHINGNKLDNRRSNLRIGTHKENSSNRFHANGKPIKGYYYSKRHDAYEAKIKIDGRSKSLGYFKVEQDARNAYLAALADRNKFHFQISDSKPDGDPDAH